MKQVIFILSLVLVGVSGCGSVSDVGPGATGIALTANGLVAPPQSLARAQAIAADQGYLELYWIGRIDHGWEARVWWNRDEFYLDVYDDGTVRTW
jgi:hypothetical protein